jgi:hypothetical protein
MPVITMKSSAPICPVPLEQQPINEYQDLRESWFFRWGTIELRSYLMRSLVLWLTSWLIAAPVAAVSFPLAKYPIQFFLSGSAGASVIPALALLRLYLGWSYVRDRLAKETIFYEESGWYDGQTWSKPEEVLQRDRLIVAYEIQPILQRLNRTFGVLALLFVGGGLTWSLL